MATIVTISLGVAGRGNDRLDSVEALMVLADTQLYKAKAAGRGRVCGSLLESGSNLA
jgi:PleD family two-component response regulator